MKASVLMDLTVLSACEEVAVDGLHQAHGGICLARPMVQKPEGLKTPIPI